MVTKLDRLAWSPPDARAIADGLTARQMSLSLGGSIYDSTDASGRHLVSLVHSGEYSSLEVAELFGVGRSTVYRAIQRQRLAAVAAVTDAPSRRLAVAPSRG